MVDVSVIMACYNGEETLSEALASLTGQGWDGTFEIILADNGSTDASAAIFADHARRHPGIAMRRIDASAERGKVAALNAGLAAASGQAFVFLDCDDTVAPGWLAAMARALRRHDFVAGTLDTAALNEDWVQRYRATKNETGLRRLTHHPHCLLAGGGQMGFTRRVLEAVGGFDPAFPVQEDHDFCVRAHLAGFELVAVPEARYNYRFRDDVGAIYAQAFSYARARALLRKLYAPAEPMLSPVPWILLARRILRLGGFRAMAGLRRLQGRPLPPLDRARLAAKLGKALGEAAGAVAFGVAPPRRAPAPVPVSGRTQPDA